MSGKNKLSWLWLFISIFIVAFIGNQLIEAYEILEISNIRTTNIVRYEANPFWFIFVVSFKSLFVAGCSAYILVFIKRFAIAK